MLLIVENDPQFVLTKDITIYTSKGDLHLDAGEPIGFVKTADGRLFYGEMEDEESDVLEFKTKTVANDMLEACQAADFVVALDEDGDSFLKTVLVEGKNTLTEKIDRISLVESVPEKTIPINKIRNI